MKETQITDKQKALEIVKKYSVAVEFSSKDLQNDIDKMIKLYNMLKNSNKNIAILF